MMLTSLKKYIKAKLANTKSNTVPLSDDEIRKYLKESAENGNKEDQYGYACYCIQGVGGEINLGHAEYWLNISANSGSIDAQSLLGQCYYNGDFLGKNVEKGMFWLTVAATNGDKEAQSYMINEIDVKKR